MNPQVASLHEVFDAALAEAARQGVIGTGSQLVGLVPLGAILAAGDHYLAKQGRTTGVPEAERVHTAVLSLGLDDLAPFVPAEKILEYRYRGAPRGLRALRLTEFADELSSESPAPGGSVARCAARWPRRSRACRRADLARRAEPARPAMAELGERPRRSRLFLDAVDRDARRSTP